MKTEENEYTEEDYRRDMKEHWEEERAQLKKDQRCIRKQQKKLSAIRFQELDYLMYIYENHCRYEIVQEHKGTKEKEYSCRYHYFKDGECTQDITGDYSCSGTIWFPIGNGNYFKFDYWG
ncbi:MAG: hypothetical protein GY928_23870 [Colwellia sp.]|nr:hypothetical protein [Colwellia sp.]